DLDVDLRRRDAALVADITRTAARWQAERSALLADLSRAHSIDASLRPDRSTIYVNDSRGTLVPLASGPILGAAQKILDDVKVRLLAAEIDRQHQAAAARGTEYKPPRGEHGEWLDS